MLGALIYAYGKPSLVAELSYQFFLKCMVVASFAVGTLTNNYLGYLAAFAATSYLLTESKADGKPFKAFIFVGNICYSVYLLHIPILGILQKSDISEFSVYFTSMITSLIVATISFVLIEDPMNSLGKKMALNKSP